jgi:hypothetical protein
MLIATARQDSLSVTQCVAPAVAHPFFDGRTAAGMRPLCGGRWLTGFKDLWLTRPLTAPNSQ